jgi:hypothetical protein
VDTGFGRLNGIVLIVRGACGTCQIVDVIYFSIIGKGNVMPYQFKVGVTAQMGNVPFLAGKKIVKADDIVFFFD